MLVCAAHDNDIVVSPIPGASAVIAALSVAGLATDRFSFEGFGPAKKGARREWLQALASEKRTMVFYESVHRIADCLADMVEILGADRAAFIGRELTKIHEQCVQDSLHSLQEMVADGTIISKGEFVIAVAGTDKKPASSLNVDWLLLQLAEDLPAKNAAKIAARISGKKKNQLYDRLLQLQKSK
jgi:16S rRNA (cytidine1402-2'-O)-methyltransferase